MPLRSDREWSELVRTKIWYLTGGLCGLFAGLVAERILEVEPIYLRVLQVALVIFGAMIAASVYKGAYLVAGGHEPTESTDRPGRRRWLRRRKPVA
jgi:hypothetical protein